MVNSKLVVEKKECSQTGGKTEKEEAGVIYSCLYKYTQQHTAGLGPSPPKAGPAIIKQNVRV